MKWIISASIGKSKSMELYNFGHFVGDLATKN